MTSCWARRVAWIAALSLTACGGRSGLHTDPPDAAVAPSDSGLARRDARVGDAGALACPAAGEVGFRLVALESPDFGFDAGKLSVGGDGRAVYLIAHESLPGMSVLHVYALDPAGGRARELGSVPSFDAGRITVDDGVARVVGREGSSGGVVLVEVRDGEVLELGRTEFYHSTRFVPVRPAWNGTDLIAAGLPGFFGPLSAGTESTPWATLEGQSMAIAAQPEAGITRLVHRGADGLTYQPFDREGAPLAPVLPLAEPELVNGVAFGWLDDGSEQPIVVAGIQLTEPGTYRALLQRYRLDGTRGGGFSAPLADGYGGTVDLTTVAAPPLTSGYGMVVASTEEAFFHGAGRDFVGDASELPVPCGGASIAAGPCGYVIACQSGEGPRLVLAIPPNRR